MAKAIKFKSWSDTAVSTVNFKMTTKYTDLGAPDAKKSIIGIICNFNKGSVNTTNSHAFFALRFMYRTSLDESFKQLLVMNNSYQNNNANQSIEIVKNLPIPLKDVYNIQIKLEGLNIKNDFSVNDIGIIFRKYRDTNVVSLNE